MPAAWIEPRRNKTGLQYRVRFRQAGHSSPRLYGGSFRLRRHAEIRRDFILGEMAAGRVPNLRLVAPERSPTVLDACDRWRATRVDVTPATQVLHRVALARVTKLLGSRRVDELTPADVADLVGKLAAAGKRRETIKKSVGYLRCVLDDEGLTGDRNPARGAKLPREERAEVIPPTAAQVEAAFTGLPRRYQLPLLVLEQTGMRVGELEKLTWGDVDEANTRWRVSRTAEKTRRGRWVPVDGALFDAVLRLRPREDRDPAGQVFTGFGVDKFRTALARACRDSGTPLISPHDLRHRRISVWHRAGISWAEIGRWVGQRNISVTADTYTHVIADDRELDLFGLLADLDR